MFVKNRRPPLVRLAMVAGAIGLFLLGYYWGNWYQFRNAPPPDIEGVLLRPAQELPGFELHNADGIPFTEKDLRGHWTLIAFADLRQAEGHLAVNRLIDIYNRLADQRDLHAEMQLVLAAKVQALELAQDFSRLSPALKVLSGKADEVDRLREAVGDNPKPETATAEGVNAPIFLVDPKGRLLALFTGSEPPAAIANDLSALAARPDLLSSEQHD